MMIIRKLHMSCWILVLDGYDRRHVVAVGGCCSTDGEQLRWMNWMLMWIVRQHAGLTNDQEVGLDPMEGKLGLKK